MTITLWAQGNPKVITFKKIEKNAPKRKGVYLIVIVKADNTKEVIYIGHSKNIFNRLQSHEKKRFIKNTLGSLTNIEYYYKLCGKEYYQYPDPAFMLEQELIIAIRPLLNDCGLIIDYEN